ncbi:hypothetical protein SXCC_00651 [Gluconacetobacter sp. SXCC-1]|nr:hypothetical protein SXCC_00651 [Gluconacetobacter sp. SXCC-1]
MPNSRGITSASAYVVVDIMGIAAPIKPTDITTGAKYSLAFLRIIFYP